MATKVSALDMATQDMKRALEARLFYAALAVALTIPDICASLEAEDGRTGSKAYKNWCDRYIAKKLKIPSSILYHTRCGMFHTGRVNFPKQEKVDFGLPSSMQARVLATGIQIPPAERALFVIPIDEQATIHCNLIGDAVQFDLGLFCQDMLDSLTDWWQDQNGNATVQKNMENLMYHYPAGLPPYINRPVIA